MPKKDPVPLSFIRSDDPATNPSTETDDSDLESLQAKEEASKLNDIRAAEAFRNLHNDSDSESSTSNSNSTDNVYDNDNDDSHSQSDKLSLKKKRFTFSKSPSGLYPKSPGLNPKNPKSPGLKGIQAATQDTEEDDVNLKDLADYLMAPESLSRIKTTSSFRQQQKLIDQQTPRFLFYSDKTKPLRGTSLHDIPLWQTSSDSSILQILESSPFWINVCSPTGAEVETLSRLFKIHPLTTEDIQSRDSRERCEIFPNYYFVCIQSAYEDEEKDMLIPISVHILVFKQCVLTFHSAPMNHIDKVLDRIKRLTHYGGSFSPDWLNYALMDEVCDGFLPSINYLETEVDSIDQLVLVLTANEMSDMLRRIGNARRKVTFLQKFCSKTDLIKQVIKRTSNKVEGESGLYLSDIQDHIFTMTQQLDHSEEVLSRTHQNYLAQISIEMAAISNRSAELGNKATIVAAILIPWNIVAGLFGMNVRVPGRDVDGEECVWFWGLVGGMSVWSVIAFYLCRNYFITSKK